MSKLLSDLRKGIKPPPIKPPQVNGRMVFTREESESSSSEDESAPTNDYARAYVEQEMKMYAKFYREDIEGASSGLLDLENTSVLAASDIRSDVLHLANTPEIYKLYNFDVSTKKELTIDFHKEEILNLMKANSVVVIQGPTGCGKTTQVPQFILDDCRLAGKSSNIVVTQPRKIATINVARRVCDERAWCLGTVCGYQVGLQKEVGPNVILTYMTTGVLLQKLIMEKNLQRYTHIIVDEIHERDQDLDFLLLIIRKLLNTNSPYTKVILMSATIDANEFSYYFRQQDKEFEINAPIIEINEPNKYKTRFFYIEHITRNVDFAVFDQYKPETSTQAMNTFIFLMNYFNEIDEKNLESGSVTIGSVLVFLPGLREIEEVDKLLKTKLPSTGPKWTIIPLHSTLPNEEQAKAFIPPQPGHRKIILATNIAESSITVPDIVYVVDFCLTKVMVVDPVTKFPSLQMEWASHVNCDQRAGRAGRVSNGRVYRLVPQEFYKNVLAKKGTPEMLRAPLENVVLKAKMLNFSEEPKAVLALAINPPKLHNIDSTIWKLKECGAMLQTRNGRPHLSDGDITFLGIVMAALPLDVRLSKLIVLGHMYSVLRETIIMAAGCSVQNIFTNPYNQRLQAYNKKLFWADGSNSDFIALQHLYDVWQSYKRENYFRTNQEEFVWCKTQLVSLRCMKEWQVLIKEIECRLKHYRIEETSGPEKVILNDTEKPTVLKIIICGAFYPNYFVRSPEYGQVDEREAVKLIGGRDPFRTVYLTGMEAGQPSQLYVRDIRKLFDQNENISIGFDGSSKIYVEFKNYQEPEAVNIDGQQYVTTIPGKISLSVYRAIRQRQLKSNFTINVLPKGMALDYVTSYELMKKITADECEEQNCFSLIDYSPLPSLDTEYITITVSHRIDAGHFWCQNFDGISPQLLKQINFQLNRTPLKPIQWNNFNREKLYVARYSADGLYYRCKIVANLSREAAQVIFVDYGNTEVVNRSEMFEMPEHDDLKVAPLAIECVLSEVQPSLVLHPKALWSDDINRMFDRETAKFILYGKVYSVVDDVVHLELFKNLPKGPARFQSINEWIVSQGFAEKIDESYLSKENHEKRKYVLNSENPNNEARKLSLDVLESYTDYEPPTDDYKKYMKSISLNGPFSPLEMKIHGVITHSAAKQIIIEPSSVNAVLLDTDPQDPHLKMVVAAEISQSATGDRLIIRQTTLMPHLPGLPALVSLLFCPCMEPKITEDGSKVAAILCGLGYNERTGRPNFPEHDLVMTLDIQLDEDIINMVNELRYFMDQTLETMMGIYENENRINAIEPLQRSVKKKLFELLEKKFKSVEPTYIQFADKWNKFLCDTDILKPNVCDTEKVWPLHSFVKLKYVNEKIACFKKNLDELISMAKKLIPMEKDTRCECCDVELFALSTLRSHILSAKHKEKVASLMHDESNGLN